MNPNYPDDLIIADRFGPGDLVFSYDEVVEMGGWDIDYFNEIVVNDDEMRDVMFSFVYTSAREAYDEAPDALDEIEDALYKSTFSVESEVRDGFIKNERERYSAVQVQVQAVLSTKADDHANYILSGMTGDEILAVFTQGGCYKFETPTVYIRDIDVEKPDSFRPGRPPVSVENLEMYLSHLFRFQTNLFLSMMKRYIDDDSYRLLAPFKENDFIAVETVLDELRKEGEEA